jgi:hypothetical protein
MANTHTQKQTSDTFSKPARHDFPNMPLLTELKFLWEQVFYKYIAPTALDITSELTPWKIRSATAVRSKDWATKAPVS